MTLTIATASLLDAATLLRSSIFALGAVMINTRQKLLCHQKWIFLLGSAFVLVPPAHTQEQELRSAMSSRVKELADGAQSQYDTQNRINAGYFRIRIEPVGLQSASICPDAVLDRLPKADRDRWKSIGGQVVDVVFKRNFIWGIDATVVLRPDSSNTAPETAAVTLSLITIKDPKRGNCEIKIGGVTGASTVDYESFLVPLGSGPANYSDRIQVNLRSSYVSETDRGRVKALWDSLVKPVAGAIFAPAATVVGAVSDQAQTAITTEMNRNVIASFPVTFKADPGTGQRARKIFLKLDFINLPDPGGVPTTITGGVTIALEYQASVFLSNASFYRDIMASPAMLLNTTIRTAGGDKTIASQLSDTSFIELRFLATTTDRFEGGCATVRNQLVSKGLSSVDTAVFLWALASENPSVAVKTKVWDIPCIKASETDLAKVGIKPPPPDPKPVDKPKRQASLAEMHKAMDNLATMMQLGSVNDDLAQRFAPRVTLIVDEHARGRLQLDDYVLERDRAAALQILASRFTRLGCYGPRLSSPDLQLPMRPSFPPPLTQWERASAAIGLLGGRDGIETEPLILSFKYGPVAEGETAQISTVSIAARGADLGPVMREITENRRPVSCPEHWMNPIFAK